ncbi:MAG: Fic family protein [Gammaproteobacteria bacterium]
MQRESGKYITKKVKEGSYKVYVPAPLPPTPAIVLDTLAGLLEQTATALADLNNMAKAIPNTSLFIYMYVRKEALLSSQIEGTQSSFSDVILFENHQKINVTLEDVEEVSNYIQAIYYGLNRLQENFPLCMRLLKEMHGVLLAGARGAHKLPGEIRRSQNWIGGTRPGNALFVPPPVECLSDCLSDLEKFLHDQSLPVLIKAGIAHVQFETIHPFLDGNGRLGRLLIILLLIDGGLLDEPILYLSLYLKQNRNTYYQLLQEVRTHGTWETWLEFFLKGVLITSKQALETANSINNLFVMDMQKIATLGRSRLSCEQAFEFIKRLPQVSAILLAKELNVSLPTARNSLNQMVDLGILEEITGKQRDKIYLYKNYLAILEEGTEPL